MAYDPIDGHSASACVVKRLGAEDSARWDAFVREAPQATFFHRAAWRRLIEDELGHRGHYLYAERDGAITGVLPLAEIRSLLFGHALISTPFCVYGGALALDAQSKGCLTRAASDLAERLQVDYLEMRNPEPDDTGWPVKDLYVNFSRTIPDDVIGNLKAIPVKRRNMVRKAQSAGLEARHDGTIDEFYRVYAESVRNLGTPVLPRRWYARLRETFPEDWEITIVSHQGQPVATAMCFYFRGEVHPYYAGSVWRARDLAANDFMYWALMQRAAERGTPVFNFGRSKQGTGSGHFKKLWGFKARPLPYAYHLVRASEMPNISPTNAKYQMFIKAWQHLPLRVSCALGPWLARKLG
jgi:FemAB-related protein (PEP-CTERM system-associated)